MRSGRCKMDEVLKRGLNRFLNQEEKKRGRPVAVPIIIVRLPGQRAGRTFRLNWKLNSCWCCCRPLFSFWLSRRCGSPSARAFDPGAHRSPTAAQDDLVGKRIPQGHPQGARHACDRYGHGRRRFYRRGRCSRRGEFAYIRSRAHHQPNRCRRCSDLTGL